MKWIIIKVITLLSMGIIGLSMIGCSPSQNNLTNTVDVPRDTDNTIITASSPERPLMSENKSTSQEPLEKPSEHIPVLYYHSVMVEPGNELRVPPEQFETQMRYLSAHGYHVVSLDQLYKYFYEKGTLPVKPVVITFDDGYEDNYTIAYPILKKYGYTATVFVVTSYINGKGYMSWEQLKELGDKGWQIEGHTINHPSLVKDKLTEVVLNRELIEAKDTLEKCMGRTVKFFAYPFGDYNSDVVQEVTEAGYLMAFTTERGWANSKNPMQVHRVYCFANMGIEEFARRLQNPQY
ncbi:MAG: polysaccharide deacetylase family protein [Desulfitobacteriaceae bacterium]